MLRIEVHQLRTHDLEAGALHDMHLHGEVDDVLRHDRATRLDLNHDPTRVGTLENVDRYERVVLLERGFVQNARAGLQCRLCRGDRMLPASRIERYQSTAWHLCTGEFADAVAAVKERLQVSVGDELGRIALVDFEPQQLVALLARYKSRL